MAKKITSARIQSLDSKYMGEENRHQEWAESPTWTAEKFYREYGRMLKFYSYYCDSGVLKEVDIPTWMERNGYSKEQIRAVLRAPRYYPSGTACAIARMINLGMPDRHPDHVTHFAGRSLPTDPSQFVREEIQRILSDKSLVTEEAEVSVETALPQAETSVYDKMVAKVWKTVIMELDVMLDGWIRLRSGEIPQKIDLHSILIDQNVPGPGCKIVSAWLDRHIAELTAAIDNTCPQTREGYSFLTTKEMKHRRSLFQEMRADVDKFSGHKKATRKVRTKKTPSAEKQISKLNYLRSSSEYKVTSVMPVRIPNSHRLFTFNVKTRILSIYTAQSASGLSVKGSKIMNTDGSASAYRLRKPDDILPAILSKTDKQIDKLISDLTTKPSVPNGRINEDTVLVRIFDSK